MFDGGGAQIRAEHRKIKKRKGVRAACRLFSPRVLFSVCHQLARMCCLYVCQCVCKQTERVPRDIQSHLSFLFFSVKRDPYISAFEEQLSTIARACFSFQNKNRFLFSVLVSLRPSIKRLDRYYNYISKKKQKKMCVCQKMVDLFEWGLPYASYLCWLAKPISALIESD